MSYSLQAAVTNKSCLVPKGRAGSGRAPATSHAVPAVARQTRLQTYCSGSSHSATASDQVSRRDVMQGTGVMGVAALLSETMPAFADGDEAVELKTYYGAANPPATYGGVGGTTKDKARYSFSVPTSWTEEAVSKIEKGTNGTDVRLVGPSARKKEKVYVVSLANEGGKGGFSMEDRSNTLASLSGSDSALQDALSTGTITTSELDVDGQRYFDYVIEGADSFLVRVTTRQGRLFGMFVNAKGRAFTQDRALFDEMINTFRTYDLL